MGLRNAQAVGILSFEGSVTITRRLFPHTHTHTHTRTHTHTNTNTHTQTQTQTHIYTHILTDTHTHTHTSIHKHTHKHTQYNSCASVISSSQRSLPMQHEKHKEKQPCPQWDSNPQSRQSSGSRSTPQTHGKQDLLLIQSAPFSLCFCFRHLCCMRFCFVKQDLFFFWCYYFTFSLCFQLSPLQQ